MTNQKSPSQQSIDLKDQILAYLRVHPRNYTAAAAHVGLSRLDLLELRNQFLDEFHAVEDMYLDLLEELCCLRAQGLPVPQEYIQFDFNKAMKILQSARSHDWGPTSKIKHINPGDEKNTPSNGQARKMVHGFAKSQGGEFVYPRNWSQ